MPNNIIVTVLSTVTVIIHNLIIIEKPGIDLSNFIACDNAIGCAHLRPNFS